MANYESRKREMKVLAGSSSGTGDYSRLEVVASEVGGVFADA